MPRTEKFSVLMSLYEKENPLFLDMSLESVFSQTVLPNQVVLVLDGPIGSALAEVVNKYKELYPYLEVYPLEKNKGLSTALNTGLQVFRNEIVFRMDTDDICYPHRFERTLKEYNLQPDLEIVGAFATMISESGEEIKQMRVPTSEKDIYKEVWTCPFIHPTVSFKKSSIINVGSYNPNSGPRQDDYELWFRCVENRLKCKNIDEPLVYYRFFNNSIDKNSIIVGWYRAKVGIRGSFLCKCPMIAYVGVFYPLIRACMPPFLRRMMYRVADRINPRTR